MLQRFHKNIFNVIPPLFCKFIRVKNLASFPNYKTFNSFMLRTNGFNFLAPKVMNILVTGAANPAGIFIFRGLVNGKSFATNPLKLILNDIPKYESILNGIKEEIEECYFENLVGVEVKCNPEKAFEDVDYVIMLSNKMGIPSQASRLELLKETKPKYLELGSIINATASSSTKFIVVEEPAEPNCLLLQESAKNIPSKNFTSLNYLDQNRATAAVADILGVQAHQIHDIMIWGSSSSFMYTDLTHALILSTNKEYVSVKHFIENPDVLYIEIPKLVRERLAILNDYDDSKCAISLSRAIILHIKSLFDECGGPESTVPLGVKSIGQYGIPSNIVFGTPCYKEKGGYRIADDIFMEPIVFEQVNIAAQKLLDERNLIM